MIVPFAFNDYPIVYPIILHCHPIVLPLCPFAHCVHCVHCAPLLFMRLTPDSRAPAKADPWKVCVGCNPCPSSGVVVVVVVVVVVFLLLLLLLADVGPIWAQVCPCLGPRLLLLLCWCWCWCCCCCCLLLLLLADVGPIWAQVCPCLGPRLAHVAHILA